MTRTQFKPPTIEEIQAYLDEHPDLTALTAIEFYEDYATEWIDTQGRPVRNWKLKLRTRNRIARQFNHSRKKTKLYPIRGKVCSQDGCKMPAVYISKGSAYDHPYCAEHMPDKVREQYE